MFFSLFTSFLIISILPTLAVVSLSSARAKARDASRIATITNFKTAVEVYAVMNDMYPVSGGIEIGGPSARALATKGFLSTNDTVWKDAIMPSINPDPYPSKGYHYRYWSNGEKYVITFDIESTHEGPYIVGKNLIHSDRGSSAEPAADQDNDGLPDRAEALFGSDPLKNDSDNDGYGDAQELEQGYNPNGPGKLKL